MYTFVAKIIEQKNPNKESTERINGENPIIYQCIVKFQNLMGRISVPPFQKQPFTDVLQSKCP